MLLAGTNAHAQTRDRVDNRGKEFWIGFLHTNGFTEFAKYEIVISCEKPTRGTITYVESGQSIPVTIPVANVPERITLDTFQLILPDPIDQETSRKILHVQFDDEVTIYGLNTMRWSSDAFLALPDDALGNEYIILSYPNTLAPDPTGEFLNRSDFPSQFAVIATEDNTTLTIQPTAEINGRNRNQYTVTLNRGELYFAQARIDRIRLAAGRDLTGTRVLSDKPIVVYGSHQRTNIPWDDAVGRDHLVEQLPPVKYWGTRAMLTPHFQLNKSVPDENFARVLAARNGTVIKLDSNDFTTLNAGEFVQMPLDRAKLITANGPILVAQYNHSTVDERFMSLPADSLGDPFFMLIPSREQFDSSYSFRSFSSSDFFEHFINVVIPTERISSLLLDGNAVSVPFTRIQKTSYSYAQIKVSPGNHRIKARIPFGLYIYGYGPYNSYGTPGAIVFDSLFTDHEEPEISFTDTCGGAIGAAFDSRGIDFGMEDLRLLQGSSNVNLVKYPFQAGDDTIRYRLDLINPYQDGWANLLAVDTAGLERRYEFPVKGFTVSLAGPAEIPVTLDTLASLNGLEFCTQITVTNYGKFPQSISNLALQQQTPGLVVKGVLPQEILPGETRQFQVCYRHIGDTSFTVEIGITNDCYNRLLAYLPIVSGVDSLAPSVSGVSDPCSADRTYTLVDAGALNSGIQSIEIKKLVNAELIVKQPPPSDQVQIVIKRVSLWEDMEYDVQVYDAVGNTVSLADIVGGLTLAVREIDGDPVGLRFDLPFQYADLVYTEYICDTMFLENYGRERLNLSSLRMQGNMRYSIPPEQLPLSLAPGERKGIAVCVRPDRIGIQFDTLLVDFFCNSTIGVVQFRTVVDPLIVRSADRCGNALVFDVSGAPKRTFLETPVPNPAGGHSTKLTVGISEKQGVNLAIYNAEGTEVRRLFEHDIMPAGFVQIDVAVGDLPMGVYYVVLQTRAGGTETKKLVIQR